MIDDGELDWKVSLIMKSTLSRFTCPPSHRTAALSELFDQAKKQPHRAALTQLRALSVGDRDQCS